MSLVAFWERRARRLMPALVVMLCVYAAALYATDKLDGEHVSRILLGGAYLENVKMVADGIGPSGTNPLWSLAQEEQFYLVWPVLLFVVLHGRIRLAIGICAAAAVVAVTLGVLATPSYSPALWFSPTTRSLSIIVGVLAGLTVWRWPTITRSTRAVAIPALLVCVALLHMGAIDRYVFRGPLLVLALCAAAVVVTCWHNTDSRIATALSWGPLVYVGAISYSLYLWHAPVLEVAGEGGLARETAAVAVAFVLAAASYRWVEQPFRRRRKPAEPLELLESATSAA